MASYKGHLKFGILTTAGVLYFSNYLGLSYLDYPIVTLTTVTGSLLPDLDHPESLLGRRLQLLSVPLHKLFGHRTLTHSLCLIVPIYFILCHIGAFEIAIGLCAGMLSHVILDLLCLGDGVAFLYPIYPRRIHLNPLTYIKRFLRKWKKDKKKFYKKLRKKLKFK